jgi:cytidylate kinase
MLPTLSEKTALAADLGKLLQAQAMRLVTAESCTGGGLAETITDIPGSSAWFERGFVSYSNAAKQDMLHVSGDTLNTAGAVSEAVAVEMAKGALFHSPADIAVAITGIAGPTGGTAEKPVGTVWIAWAAKGAGYTAQLFQYTGDRESIRQQAIYSALHTLLSILRMTSSLQPPVITLDGPSGTGKGTLCYLLAKKLGWHYLDSGASFRVLAHAAIQKNIDLEDEDALQNLVKTLQFEFLEKNTSGHIQVLVDTVDVTADIRTEACGNAASKIAVFPAVRQALLERQRAFRKWPGLVTDGRDMGTVIFPNASLKFFLYADTLERANRRFRQLNKRGVHATLAAVLQDLEERDTRDQQRGTAPLKPSENAILIDTTHLKIEAAFAELMRHIAVIMPIPAI